MPSCAAQVAVFSSLLPSTRYGFAGGAKGEGGLAHADRQVLLERFQAAAEPQRKPHGVLHLADVARRGQHLLGATPGAAGRSAAPATASVATRSGCRPRPGVRSPSPGPPRRDPRHDGRGSCQCTRIVARGRGSSRSWLGLALSPIPYPGGSGPFWRGGGNDRCVRLPGSGLTVPPPTPVRTLSSLVLRTCHSFSDNWTRRASAASTSGS